MNDVQGLQSVLLRPSRQHSYSAELLEQPPADSTMAAHSAARGTQQAQASDSALAQDVMALVAAEDDVPPQSVIDRLSLMVSKSQQQQQPTACGSSKGSTPGKAQRSDGGGLYLLHQGSPSSTAASHASPRDVQQSQHQQGLSQASSDSRADAATPPPDAPPSDINADAAQNAHLCAVPGLLTMLAGQEHSDGSSGQQESVRSAAGSASFHGGQSRADSAASAVPLSGSACAAPPAAQLPLARPSRAPSQASFASRAQSRTSPQSHVGVDLSAQSARPSAADEPTESSAPRRPTWLRQSIASLFGGAGSSSTAGSAAQASAKRSRRHKASATGEPPPVRHSVFGTVRASFAGAWGALAAQRRHSTATPVTVRGKPLRGSVAPPAAQAFLHMLPLLAAIAGLAVRRRSERVAAAEVQGAMAALHVACGVGVWGVLGPKRYVPQCFAV